MKPLSITAYTLTNALGRGRLAVLKALQNGTSGLRPNDYLGLDLPTWIGKVDGLEEVVLPAELAAYDCRNNRLALLALKQDDFRAAVEGAIGRYGRHRIGVFVGTSTSGIEETELAYQRLSADGGLPTNYRYDTTQRLGAFTSFVQGVLGLTGASQLVSTACSSSAKVFAVASRYIAAGLCDAAVVGGTDSLCRTTLFGFNSLQLVSPRPCQPWDAGRSGISIGEAAGFALLEKPQPGSAALQLVGYGESSDAYHMSTPHPEGKGAALAMQRALQAAGLTADDVDYLNLHGTATPANDVAEDRAVLSVLGSEVFCSSTKGATGHTLGAAGITEALITCLSLEHGFVPGTTNTTALDPSLSANVLLQPREAALRIAMSNSLGFGGSNASLVFRSNA